jgi:serine/threonine protein kinase
MFDRGQSGALRSGTRVGRYEVESFLGAGGMGEVYAARDTSLGRRIALKVLPADCDRDRIARFIREAQASSSLNHPAIVSVHDAGVADGIQFLAMELVDGQPLSVWMRSRGDAGRAADLMSQVADGLACAHAAGIVHRDLKPANIMIGRDGRAKIVDFGVAKLIERPSAPDDATEMKTADGSRVGTPAYMSPEQIEGHRVDHRSDIFSFGTVLCELLSGRHPFAAASTADTIHNIAHGEPPMEAIPPQWRRVVARCLNKEPAGRYHSMTDVAHDLREPATVTPRKQRRTIAVIGAAAALIVAFAWMAYRKPQPSGPLPMPRRLTSSGAVRAATATPDGKFVVYSDSAKGLHVLQTATSRTALLAPQGLYSVIRVSPDGNYVYVRSAESFSASSSIYRVPILPTSGEPKLSDLTLVIPNVAPYVRTSFTLSPDGTKLAYLRVDGDRVALTVADLDGGREQVVLRRAQVRLPAWSPDGGSIVFRDEKGIHQLILADRTERTFAAMRWRDTLDIQWLPDGSALLVCASQADEPPQVWLAPIDGSPPARITSDVSSYYSATPLADGRSFVAVRGEGEPSISILSVAADGVHEVRAGLGSHFAFAGTRSRGPNPGAVRIRWIDAEHIIYEGLDGTTTMLFIVPAAGGEPRPFVHDMRGGSPDVSRDGRQIAFVSSRSGTPQVWSCAIDGSNLRQLTRDAQIVPLHPAFSSDGQSVYYHDLFNGNVWRVATNGEQQARVGLKTMRTLEASFDGRWMMTRAPTAADMPALAVYALPGGPLRWVKTNEKDGTVTFAEERFDPSTGAITVAHWDSLRECSNLWLQDIAGGAPRRLTNFDHGDIYGFDWSPDGKSIAVVRGDPKVDVVMVRNFR